MQLSPTSPWTRFSWLAVALAACVSSGCLPGVAWLPDSSGFVYTEGDNFRQLSSYDVTTGTKRVIAADTGAATNWPALSPDGKQIAIACLRKKDDGAERVQVVVYGLDGRELHRSPESAWRPAEPMKAGGGPLMAGIHWSRQGKKLLIHDYHDKKPQSAIYDPAAQKFKLLEGAACIIGSTPVRPDDKGFLLSRPQSEESVAMVFVDWEGKESPLALEPELLDEKDKRVVLVYPVFGAARWDGPRGAITFGAWRFTLDTEKGIGSFVKVPDEQAFVAGRRVAQRYQFSTGALARVLYQKDPSDPSREKYRLELLRAGDPEPQVIIDKTDGMFLFSPSPDGKRLAIRYTTGQQENKQRIIVVDDKGQIERTVDVEQ